MSKAPINYKSKKYNLLKIMHSLSVERYRYLNKHIATVLNISPKIWNKWLYIEKEEQYQIPYDKLVEVAQLLNKKPNELINYSIRQHDPIVNNEIQPANQTSIFNIKGVE